MKNQITRVFTMNDLDVSRRLVLDRWDSLTWRHAGFGAMQAYLTEGDAQELRVHVWHPSLVKPGIADSGLCHDHRFDMTSCVLLGSILNRECVLTEDSDGAWATWEVLHARAARKLNGESFHQDPTRTNKRYQRAHHDVPVSTGSGYRFPKRAFHESHASGLTVTLVEKTNQEAFNARILAPHDKDIVHAFSHVLPSDSAVVASVLTEARIGLES